MAELARNAAGAQSPAAETAAPPVPIAQAPGAWPLLGHFIPMRRDPLGFMGSLRSHGDLVRIKAGPMPVVVVCDPALAHQVMTDLRTFDRSGTIYDRVRHAMGNGLPSTTYVDHRRQRLMMQPAFHTRYLQEYARVMQDQTAALMSGWRDGAVVDLVQEMFRLTSSIALRALFSSRIDPEDAERLRGAYETFLRGLFMQIAVPGLDRLPVPANLRYQAAAREWDKQVHSLIARYRDAEGDKPDLMARLLAARGEDGEALTDRELSEQVAALLMAGAESTSAALTWAIYLLCTHPEVLDATRVEADRVLGDGLAEWDHLAQLDLTTRVIQEAMRVYPPVWLVARTTTRDARLGDHVVRAGTTMLFSQAVLHRHPDHFPEPERFDPDRWLALGRPTTGPAITRQAYFPFGGGPTKCIGEHFATAEAVLALASILTHWNVELHDPDAVLKLDTRIVLLPRRLPVRVSTRIQ